MYSRMKAMGLITAIYIIFTLFFFEKFFVSSIQTKISLTYLGYGNNNIWRSANRLLQANNPPAAAAPAPQPVLATKP